MNLKAAWGAVKDTTRKGVQMLKEKTGLSSSAIDPEYEAAVERFHILRSVMEQFITDFQELISFIPQLSQSGVEFSQAVLRDGQNSGNDCEIGYALSHFYDTVAALVENELIPSSSTYVVEEISGLRTTFTRLTQLKEERSAAALLANSCRDQLNSASASIMRPEEITSLRIKYEAYQADLEKKSHIFEKEVNSFWELRFTVIDLTMQRFVGLIYSLCKKTFDELKVLQAKISHDALVAEYPPKVDVKL